MTDTGGRPMNPTMDDVRAAFHAAQAAGARIEPGNVNPNDPRSIQAEIDRLNRARAAMTAPRPVQPAPMFPPGARPVQQPKPARSRMFQNLAVNPGKGTIRHGLRTYPLPATVTVDTEEEVKKRVTATRVIAGGLIAGPAGMFVGGAARKANHNTKVFLTFTGDGWSFVEEVDGKHSQQARDFAAYVNALAGSGR